ncbi:MAG: NAD(P)/FAD-dependent oxidoreductase [Pseudomonadota bacterium]
MQVDVVILGAGAAGLFCAIEAARRGRRVVVIDHAKSPGEKIRISGGGRCNFTNLDIQPDRFLSQNSRFALSALKRYTQWDFIARVDQAGIAWHEKTLGQLFCDGKATQIIEMLTGELAQAQGQLELGTQIEEVSRKDSIFQVKTSNRNYEAASVVVATGGKSVPKLGASSLGYTLARQFGLDIVETRPALVPLTFAEQELATLKQLAGISVDARVSCSGTAFEEGLLFTHRGLSGPSILQISSYWTEGDALSVDLHRKADLAATLKQLRQSQGRISTKNALARFLPEKLAARFAAAPNLVGNLADRTNSDLEDLAETIHNWVIKPVGSEGYRTAEVTLGGVSTDALNARTMESRSTPGLFFIGEVVDVTGWLGGYNFQWAWSSGWAAGQVA